MDLSTLPCPFQSRQKARANQHTKKIIQKEIYQNLAAIGTPFGNEHARFPGFRCLRQCMFRDSMSSLNHPMILVNITWYVGECIGRMQKQAHKLQQSCQKIGEHMQISHSVPFLPVPRGHPWWLPCRTWWPWWWPCQHTTKFDLPTHPLLLCKNQFKNGRQELEGI